MSLKRNPYLLIPIFLNVILLAGVPYFGGLTDVVGLVPLLVLAFATPWFLYFLIGRILADVEKKARREGDGPEDTDFI